MEVSGASNNFGHVVRDGWMDGNKVKKHGKMVVSWQKGMEEV